MWFLRWILSLLSSPFLNKIADVLLRKAENESKIHGSNTVAATAGVLGWLYAESKFRETQSKYLSSMGWPATVIILGTAIPFVLHVAAIALDSTFAFGWRIPKLPPPYDQMEREIILSFFLTAPAVSAVRAIAMIFKK
jgi:hypothetical protein